MPVTIRRARPDDLPAVSRLAATLVRQHHAWDQERFMLIEPVDDGYRWFFSHELERQAALILVAELGDDDAGQPMTLAGYAYATVEQRDWNDLLDACGKLNDLFVDPAARRRGVARALVNEVFAWFRAQQTPRVVLLSAWRNPEAHAFFETLGFRRTMVEMTAEL